MADHVIVMKDGKVVEEGDTQRIFDEPHHPYTMRLMAAALSGEAVPDTPQSADETRTFPLTR
jgi:ABC-type dipeptide/oligopeptide/nickel transport system ATPase component